MDFIERIFALYPDGGTGATELLFFAFITAAVIIVSWHRLPGVLGYFAHGATKERDAHSALIASRQCVGSGAPSVATTRRTGILPVG